MILSTPVIAYGASIFIKSICDEINHTISEKQAAKLAAYKVLYQTHTHKLLKRANDGYEIIQNPINI